MGTKGSKRGENEGWNGSSSHCIPTRHIPVHIWLQYTRSTLQTIPHSPSQTHKTQRSLTCICTGTHAQIHIHNKRNSNAVRNFTNCFLSFFSIILSEKLCLLPSISSHQASFLQSCSGGTVGWLKVFKAAPIPW